MIRLALPAGELRAPLADLLTRVGLRVQGYGEGSRSYRLAVDSDRPITVRVFREKDIPIQVALGNYDLGICSLAWISEIQVRFPQQPLLPLCDLGIGAALLCVAVAPEIGGVEGLASMSLVRIASEYPNLADLFARAARLPRYRIQAVWGGAEAYPPEDADAAVTALPDETSFRSLGLEPVFSLLRSSAWLVANAEALAANDLTAVVGPLLAVAGGRARPDGLELPRSMSPASRVPSPPCPRSTLRLAVPDGHQQRHAVAALAAAGLHFAGYDESQCQRRPQSGIEGLEVKVLRPHDMPQLVAVGDMDLAITGRDCLLEHRYAFPSSPAEEVLDLGRGQYNLCAVVTRDLAVDSMDEALEHWRQSGRPSVRVASEFPTTADHYARSRHFWRYQIIPIAGASEGFVPEDADVLIEGTETGRTLAENNLKAIDLLYRSTTCVIAHRDLPLTGQRRHLYNEIMAALRRAAGGGQGL